PLLGAVDVQGPRHGAAQAAQVRAAARVVGVVGVAAHALLFAGRILQGHLDAHLVLVLVDVNGLVQGVVALVEELDDLGHAAGAADLGHGPLAQGGDGLGPHAVQAGGGLVGALVELGPGADGGHDDFQGRPAGLGVDVHGDAAAVVRDADAAVHVDLDLDGRA